MLVHGLSKTFENPWCHTTGLSKLLSPVVALRYHDLVASPETSTDTTLLGNAVWHHQLAFTK